MSTLDFKSLDDMPIVAISDQSTEANNTGSWKSVEPRYEDKVPPCANVCPAGNDISRIMVLLASGKVAEAAQVLRAENPLPATLGRVCPHFCEGKCNRESLGGAITVHMLERFVGESSLRADIARKPKSQSGRKVAIVGAGPAGITAAYVLARAGHKVEVFDDKPQPGGYLRTGIPDYRLPKSILDAELSLVTSLGVTFTQNTRIGRDVSLDDLRKWFDAVIVAVGLHKSRGLRVPGEDHPNVYNGVELLERILRGERPNLPPTVAVVGGGNTAMDVARSVLRLGVKPIVVYRRTEAEMPAIASEVREAKQEGVEFRFLEAPTAVVIEDGTIVGLECQKMRLGEADASGRPRPVPVAGSEFRLPVAGVVAATGESADLSFLPENAAETNIFLAGDASTGDGTVTAAVGDGRRVAHMVDAFLQTGSKQEKTVLQKLWQREVNLERVAGPEALNTAYFVPEPRPGIRSVPGAVPPTSFAEIVQGFDEATAIAEARRCLTCGTCNGCLNCYFWCPDIAIHGHPQNGGLQIDARHCKGCGICVEECPRGAMSIGEVSR